VIKTQACGGREKKEKRVVGEKETKEEESEDKKKKKREREREINKGEKK
jgi:hypothetical protein